VVTKNRIAIAAVIFGVLVVVWFYNPFQTEADRIRQQLDELADVVSTTQEKRDAVRLLHIAGLKQFFTQDVTVQIKNDIPKVRGRDNLLKMAHVALQQEPNLILAFTDISVSHEDGAEQAWVNTTVVVTGVQSRKAKSVDAQELEMNFVKAEGEWLIQAVKSVQAMELQ
jgi:hypothetical protein